MKKVPSSLGVICCVFFCVAFLQSGICQDAPALEVRDAAVCTAMENGMCADAKEEFPASVAKLYCFTRITGAAGNTEITHVWYYGDVERARVTLAVRSSSYRTYSSKRIQAHEIGKWRVEVLGPGGSLLKTIPFAVVQ